MLMNPSNFLLLDEPTNHLDMRAKDVLLRALQEFTGTVVFVSHDRYFLEELATRVIEVGGGEVQPFPGTYQEFQWTKKGEAPAKLLEAKLPAAQPTLGFEANGFGKVSRVNPIKLRQMKERCAVIEEKVSQLEDEIADRERGLADYQGAVQASEATEALAACRRTLENLLAEWEEVSQTIEANA